MGRKKKNEQTRMQKGDGRPELRLVYDRSDGEQPRNGGTTVNQEDFAAKLAVLDSGIPVLLRQIDTLERELKDTARVATGLLAVVSVTCFGSAAAVYFL